MPVRIPVLLALILLVASLVVAQDQSSNKNQSKKKNLLPADVINARTVLVLVDPDTGVSMTDPNGNRAAQQDVEKAVMRWGRLSLAMIDQEPDLIFTVRKGSGNAVTPTIGGVPVNDRPVILEGDDSTIRIGGQKGGIGGQKGGARPATDPRPRMEVGPTEDTFVVYRGNVNSPPVWRYTAKGALRSPGVPAVNEFRKVLEEAEKQQKSKP